MPCVLSLREKSRQAGDDAGRGRTQREAGLLHGRNRGGGKIALASASPHPSAAERQNPSTRRCRGRPAAINPGKTSTGCAVIGTRHTGKAHGHRERPGDQ